MKCVFVSLLMALAFFGNSVAIEIHAPWAPGEKWEADRVSSSFHKDEDDNCVDFNRVGGSDNGSPILSVADGTVVTSGWSNGSGWHVWIEEEDGSKDVYGHLLLKPFVAVNELVKTGQVIGLCGCTPDGPGGRYCTGYHLHFGHYVNGVTQRITSIDGQVINQDCCSQVVSRNTNLLDQAYNRYGSNWIGWPEYRMWELEAARRANPNHPWYYAWNPNDLYDSRGMPRNCVIWHFNGGNFGDNAVVYDALGGARAAIVLHSGFWTFWTQRGGPTCPAKMPIRDESNVPANLRSYYRDNYKENGNRLLDGITAVQECADGVMLWNGSPHFAWYPFCAPGYYEDGWHADASYLFVECFNRNGGSQNLGHAVPVGTNPSRVHKWGGYDVQDFRRPDETKAIIFYDPEGAKHNPSCSTNEAYCVYDRNILAHFERYGDVDKFGCPTIDQFEINGRTAQDFYEHRSGKHWRLETDGRNVYEIDLSRCVNNNQMAKAMTDECHRSPNNLIANGSFESCLDCWEANIWPPEHCRVNLAPPMAEFRIIGNGSVWSAQLKQVLPRLTTGERLILIYDQRGVRTVHTVLELAEQVNGQYLNCGLWQDYRHAPGTGWQEYRIPFTVTRTTSNAKLTWSFGETDGSMFRIRNIRLVPDNTPPPPPPPTCAGDDPGSFIGNGRFQGQNCWSAERATHQYVVFNFNGQLEAHVNGPFPANEVTVSQDWVYLTGGSDLELVFTAAANNPSKITAVIECSDGSYPLWQDVNLTLSDQRFVLPFRPATTDPGAKLIFYIGQVKQSVWIKNVIVRWKQASPPPPPPTCSGQDDPGSFISNGSFTRGLDCWQFYKASGLEWLNPVVQPDHALRVDVNGPRPWYDVKLWQDWVYLTANAELEVVFTAAASQLCAITAVIECSDGSYPLWQDVNLTSSDQRFVLPFWPKATDPAAKLIFYLGSVKQSVWLKDVSVRWKQANSASISATLSVSPNPLNPSATFSFTLDQALPVKVEIYDVSGRRVQMLFTGELPAGHQAIVWDGRDDQANRVSSGIYFARVRAGTDQTWRRLIVVR